MAHENDQDHGYVSDRVPSDLLGQMGYETRDVGPTAILRWIVCLFVFIGVVSVGVLFLENQFIPETGQVAYQSEFYRTQPIRNNPPMPQLQTLPKRDMIMYRRDEKRIVDGYSRTSEGRVSIPVGEAIDQIASEGIAGVKGSVAKPSGDAYPGSGKYTDGNVAAKSSPSMGKAGPATKNAGRATDILTEDRKNTPTEAKEANIGQVPGGAPAPDNGGGVGIAPVNQMPGVPAPGTSGAPMLRAPSAGAPTQGATHTSGEANLTTPKTTDGHGTGN